MLDIQLDDFITSALAGIPYPEAHQECSVFRQLSRILSPFTKNILA
jgi:hypothetical protein